jgi:hypothetical protein
VINTHSVANHTGLADAFGGFGQVGAGPADAEEPRDGRY